MNDLEKLLERFVRSSNARWWVGERPEGRDGQISRLIADRIDYPTSKADPFKDDGLVRLDRNQAAHVLAVAGTMSLAHFSGSASKGQIENASEALKHLDGDAVFLSNGFWGLRGPLSWTPLTDATFDCGVIGYDAASAFIFWVEEED